MGDPDLLELCNIVPKEVLTLDEGKSYDSEVGQKSQDSFSNWLQCYYVEGMRNLEDGSGRTIWFTGEPGTMAPKGKKGTQIPQSGEETKAESIKIEVKLEPEAQEEKSTGKRWASSKSTNSVKTEKTP